MDRHKVDILSRMTFMAVIAVLVEIVNLSIVVSPNFSVMNLTVMRLSVSVMSHRLMLYLFVLCMINIILNLFKVKHLNHLVVELNELR